ncbi:PA2169 family four-helix-bundle protein [Azospirillum sp. SYSU D00513]|uniref:ferritin-like domain-containing protein n=1 Tax=Azospirillum sp. SYSU D00513 TaxID=2812561 RepID=UPI001A970B68|nr:PA2169 family four-helix-bundle protein [Azospirillum sp. SYSU D00513]
MTEKDRIVDTLNDLIHIVEDSHEGYRQAAEGSGNDDLKALFNDLGAQRGAIVRELQRLVAEQGGAADIGGTVMGGAHRFFMELKSTVLGQDRAAILAEVQRGEAECVRRYEEALKAGLPLPVNAVIAQHLDRIRADCDRMGSLRGVVA